LAASCVFFFVFLILFWLHVIIVCTYQDYSEEFRDIGGVKGKGKAQRPEGGIALINQRIVTDDLPVNFYPFVNKNTPYTKTWPCTFI